MRVLKFGGTSMGDEHTWHKILNIISGYEQPVIIVSATARTTRQLVSASETATKDVEKAHETAEKIRQWHAKLIRNFLAHYADEKREEVELKCLQWLNKCIEKLQLLLSQIAESRRLTPKIKDAIASIGEEISSYLFVQCGTILGLKTVWVDASKIIKTDDNFGRALPDRSQIKKNVHTIAEHVTENQIPVMGGFYGSDAQGRTTTLGFEGSDYTASLIGADLQADAIEIWTDVSGIYTCDPRVVRDARPIPELSFRESTDLAYFGAKVLHPSTMKPAAINQIPIYVKNIFEPDHPGTKIHSDQNHPGWAKAITYLRNIAILTITADEGQEGPAFLADVFKILNQFNCPVKAVTMTEDSVSIALENDEILAEIRPELSKIGPIEIENKQGLISLIGCNFSFVRDIQQQVLRSVPDAKISLISYSKTKRNFNIAIPEKELIAAVQQIHKQIFGA